MNTKDYEPIRLLGNGTTKDVAYKWKTFNKTDLIVQLESVATGEFTTLKLGSDYDVNVEATGGNVLFNVAPTSDYYINVSRKIPQYQSKGFSSSPGFQGSEIEQSFDKVSCCLQDMDYNIESFKEEYTEETDQKIEDFETEINSKLTQVNEAVEQLNRLDEVLEECENYATTAEEQSIIAQQQAVQAGNSATTAENILTQIQDEHDEALADITLSKDNAKLEIQAAGIFMQNDRLFYTDSNGVTHEFRNDYGGIAPMPVKHKDIQKVENGFCLTWTDPDDSTYQENVYCTWQKTVIVRKESSYPESPYDGTVVIENSIRNQYAKEGYIDICDNTKNYKYRAFPCSINKVYSYDNKNKFGVWVYAYTELDTESNPAKRITYLEDNEHFNPNYMDFTNDIFRYEDWENSPFYSWEYIRPCMLYTDAAGEDLKGTVMEYLDPNDHSKTIDGSPSHVADQSCNAMAMVEKRKIFTKVVVNGNSRTVYFSNEKLDDDYECYQCLREDGTYNEFYYTPMFDGALINNKLVSLAGNLTPISSKTAQDEINYARAHGNGWDTEQHPDKKKKKRAFKLLFKNTDSQSVLGQGKSNGGSSVNDCLKSGTMLTKGQNWGSSSNAQGVKFRYRENFYGSQWQRFRGMVTVNGVTKVKMTRHTGDGSTATDYNLTGEGYITLNDVPATSGTSGGYVSKTVSNKYGEFSTVVSGSSSTYLCDGRWYNNSGTMYPFRGGASNNGLLCGAFCLASSYAASVAAWGIGAALSYKPL